MSEKKRGNNWTTAQIERLKDMCIEKRGIIEAKHNDADMRVKKKRTWEFIVNEVNSCYPANKRNVDEAKKKWMNLKSLAKKKNGADKKALQGTGGGPPSSPMPQVLEDIVDAYKKSDSFNGIPSGIDTEDTTITSDLENESDVDYDMVGKGPISTASKVPIKAPKNAENSVTPSLLEIEKARLDIEKESLELQKETFAMKKELFEKKKVKLDWEIHVLRLKADKLKSSYNLTELK
uniref:Regulatory protein zeste n=1 Tax=Romanomermis culicivorax TaxID=13658 RepID=A0A915JBR6_ROMCU